MQKVVFFTKSVSILGGKEKVLINLANYLAESAYAVEIVTYDGSTKSAFPVNDTIKISSTPLTFLQHPGTGLKKIMAFLKDVKTYKHSYSQTTNESYLVATDQIIATTIYYAFKKRINHLVIWEHLTHVIHTSRIWEFFRKRIYPRAKWVVTLNKEEAAWYKSWNCNIECIPNAILQNRQVSLNMGDALVWAGALTKEKGITDVIELAKLFKQNNIPNEIHVYGAGNEAGYLAERIESLGLAKTLIYKHEVKNSATIYANAAALLVTSKHECFPTVILEAFSYGIPVISYNCPTGPRNIITDNKDGFLVQPGDVEGLYNCTAKLLTNNKSLQAMGDDAYRASAEYVPEKVYPRWNKIFS